MKYKFITFLRKYAWRFVIYLDELATDELLAMHHASYRERMERKTDAKIVTKGELS